MGVKYAEGHLLWLRLGYERPQIRMKTAKLIFKTLAAFSILEKMLPVMVTGVYMGNVSLNSGSGNGVRSPQLDVSTPVSES